MEIYYDVKKINAKMNSFVTWKGLGTVVVLGAPVIIALVNLG